jgi:hypothetical protein
MRVPIQFASSLRNRIIAAGVLNAFLTKLLLPVEVRDMKRMRITLSFLIFTPAVTVALAASAAAQTVVVGTGNPHIDVPAVQAAVDQGGQVILKGHFSFNSPPTIVPALPGFPLATVLVSKGVDISGTQDEEMTTIEGGTQPFEVEARGSAVTIQGLRFVGPKVAAINVLAVSGLVIASCRIEGVKPLNFPSTGIGITTTLNPPSPAQPGHPEWVSGTLLIVNNDINMAGGTSLDNTLGIIIFSAGVPEAEVEAYISGNNIRNTTERSINLYQIGGRAYIERNRITTGTILGPANVAFGRGTDVIHVTGTGLYLVAGNLVHSRWAAGTGIRVQGQFAEWPITGAVVVDNDVNMEALEGAAFDDNSAAIDVRGYTEDNMVLDNRIRGRARAALVVAVNQPAVVAANNRFVLNRLHKFDASLADVFVGEQVMDTLIVGQGTVEDHGVGTVIVPLPLKGDDKDRHDDEKDHR